MNRIGIEMKSIKETIYLVDDDPAVLTQFIGLFERSGYEVRAFNDPRDLLAAAFDSSRVSVIVSDMRMPNLTGLELMKSLRQMHVPHPFVFVSGESTHEEIVAAHKDARVSYVLKPVLPRSLLAALEQAAALDRIRLSAETQARRLLLMQEQLTPTQQRVFEYLLKAMSIQEIASETGMKGETVKKHRQAIFNRFDCDSVYGLLRLTSGG